MNLFEINKLKCSYNNGPVVLEVNNLVIPAGKLIVIIGISGAGKSTFLETLGLMNNTVARGSEIYFNPSTDERYDFYKIWNEKRSKDIFNVRRKHFSFIFQSTNLMPNFSVFENICLTQMLQGKSGKESMNSAKEIMDIIGLEEIGENKSSYEISGGQAQRVAFVRAITPMFTILFGDEPTGNLDEKNSRDLMSILKNKLREWNKTALLVSHNIDLALEFADQIILISKPVNHGVINPDNVFHKTDNSWRNGNINHSVNEMKHYLKQILGIEIFNERV